MGVDDNDHHAVIQEASEKRSQELSQEHRTRWDIHVMTEFEIDQHILALIHGPMIGQCKKKEEKRGEERDNYG